MLIASLKEFFFKKVNLKKKDDKKHEEHPSMQRDEIVYSYFMPVCNIVKLLPRGAVDDLMHYCTRPKAECNSASGRPRYRGVIV